MVLFTTAAADEGNQILLFEASLLHTKTDGLDGVRQVDWEVLVFVDFDQRGQQFQLVAFRRIARSVHERLDALESRFALPIVLDYFGNHQIVSASTESYFSCVPRNRMYMTWCG